MDNQNKTADREAIDLILNLLEKAGIAKMNSEQKSSFLSGLMLVSYQMLRAVEGDEFVRGFFESALADLANPTPVQFTTAH